MTRTTQATALIAASLILAISTAIVRDQAHDDWEHDQQVATLANTMLDERGSNASRLQVDDSFSNGPYVGAWLAAALLFMAGVVIHAATPRAPD